MNDELKAIAKEVADQQKLPACQVVKKEYKSKDEIKAVAQEILEIVRKEKLPAWQVKEVFRYAIEMVDWEIVQ